jgi:hypothetical protein
MMCVPKRHIGVVNDVCAEETHRGAQHIIYLI